MFDFGKDQRGNVAIVFALSLIPTIGFAGAAVDYSRATAAREFMRAISDRTAIAVVARDELGSTQALATAKAAIESRYGAEVSNVVVSGRWLDDEHYTVTIAADLSTMVVQAMPAMPKQVSVSVETVTKRIPPTYTTEPPRQSLLEPEASDYNRVYMYCYDAERRLDDDRGRRAITPIADNASTPTNYAAQPGWALPQCGAGEVVSYMLRNVRGARTRPSRWDDPNQEVYEYYADASVDPDTRVMRHEMQGFRVWSGTTRTNIDMVASPILETIRCRNDAECKPASEGGVIPNRTTNRNPATATEPCKEGMSMYFGWEDRPPNLGAWTDRDYDDIRLVVSCPVLDRATDKQVMIVR